MNIKEILENLKNEQGVTLSPDCTHIVHYENGFQVSTHDGLATPSVDEAAAYIEKEKANGVWFYNNIYYLDFSEHIIDKAQALEIGAKYKQISIYDWSTGELIYL